MVRMSTSHHAFTPVSGPRMRRMVLWAPRLSGLPRGVLSLRLLCAIQSVPPATATSLRLTDWSHSTVDGLQALSRPATIWEVTHHHGLLLIRRP